MHFATSHGTWHVTTERQRAAGRTGARKRLQKGPKLKANKLQQSSASSWANHISQIRQEKAQAQWNRENFVFMEFIRIFNEERDEFQKQRRLKSLLRKGQAKTTFTMLNRGYTEEEEEYEAEDVEFQDEWRKKSIVEDYWKADDYDLEQQKPWPRLGARTDRFVDVLRDAAAAEVLDHERPVLEPLAAFRGDVRWSFDSRERLRQKLRGINVALDAIKKEEDVMRCLPENQAVPHLAAYSPPGFESAVPKGTAGGITFGQPEKSLSQQLAQMRYPTLQRVAHTLPRDPKYRSHPQETYDYLKPSEEYTEALDEKLVVNRVFGKIRRKYAPDAEYVKTYPRLAYLSE
eukprot:g18445.t1